MKDIKYLEDGSTVNVCAVLDDGYLVQFIYEDDDSGIDCISDDRIFVKKVFNEAPTVKIAGIIKSLMEREKELKGDLFKLEFKVAKEKERWKECFDKYGKVEKLKRLDDFIEGKITHYVELNHYCPKIIPVEESESKYGVKLLSLFGGSNGDLNWLLNTYDDGSGENREVQVCTSYKDARDALRDWICGEESGSLSEHMIKEASKHRIKIDEKLLSKYYGKERTELEKRRSCKLKELKSVETRIGKLDRDATRHKDGLKK